MKKFAENKEKYGYPEAFSVQNTKNSSDETYEIQKMLDRTGLSKGVLLAFQSLNEKALEASQRDNIKLEVFHKLQRRFNEEKVATFSDIILGLPEETYETFIDGVSTLIENGQHNRIQFNNLSILPNTSFGSPEFQKKYGLEIIEEDIINIHGKREEWTDGIYEKQQLVIGTKAMPREDWVKTRSFGYMTALLEFDKLCQIPLALVHSQYGLRYKDMIESFSQVKSDKFPVLSETNDFFEAQARNMQKGGAEYIHSEKWLNIWWPTDEYIFINLANKNKLDTFYQEVKITLEDLLRKKNITSAPFLEEAIFLNKELIKLPFQNSDLHFETTYNIWDTYRSTLLSEKVPLAQGRYINTADRTSQVWNSWEDWCTKVVWWGNKKGAYMYDCESKEAIPELEAVLA